MVHDLTYYYEQKKVLNGLSFHIGDGKKIALVGSSGSGKTTVIKLIVGLLKYTTGSLMIDGYHLSECCLKDLYQHISYISRVRLSLMVQ